MLNFYGKCGIDFSLLCLACMMHHVTKAISCHLFIDCRRIQMEFFTPLVNFCPGQHLLCLMLINTFYTNQVGVWHTIHILNFADFLCLEKTTKFAAYYFLFCGCSHLNYCEHMHEVFNVSNIKLAQLQSYVIRPPFLFKNSGLYVRLAQLCSFLKLQPFIALDLLSKVM